jgi:hypothetical protein
MNISFPFNFPRSPLKACGDDNLVVVFILPRVRKSLSDSTKWIENRTSYNLKLSSEYEPPPVANVLLAVWFSIFRLVPHILISVKYNILFHRLYFVPYAQVLLAPFRCYGIFSLIHSQRSQNPLDFFFQLFY